ncbi:MAG: winged helix-turn-helix transcriptional regulator [Flavobacteriales bacterium]
MNSKYKIDEIDKQILKYLVDNTRMPFTEIAKKMLVSAGTIHVRVKKMEEAGLIKGTSLDIDYNTLGYSFVAYVGVLLGKSSKTQNVIEKLREIPNVVEASVISGKHNIFCKLLAQNTNDAKDILYRIDEIPEVLRTESIISLEEAIHDRNRLLHSIFKKN